MSITGMNEINSSVPYELFLSPGAEFLRWIEAWQIRSPIRWSAAAAVVVVVAAGPRQAWCPAGGCPTRTSRRPPPAETWTAERLGGSGRPAATSSAGSWDGHPAVVVAAPSWETYGGKNNAKCRIEMNKRRHMLKSSDKNGFNFFFCHIVLTSQLYVVEEIGETAKNIS